MAEPYFLRNVTTILHDEARSNESKTCAILSQSIAQSKILKVTDHGRVSAGRAMAEDYAKTWESLLSFPDLELPLWIECQIGPGTEMGCLVLKMGAPGAPQFLIRRFTMKNDIVLQSMHPVVMVWSQTEIINSTKRKPISGFVTVRNINQAMSRSPDLVPDATRQNGLVVAGLIIGVLSNLVISGHSTQSGIVNVDKDDQSEFKKLRAEETNDFKDRLQMVFDYI